MAKQVKMTLENERGELESIYPVTTSDDVVVGKLVAGELALPGSSMDEMLKTTLENIRKFLTNMQDVASTKRVVTDTIADAADTDIPSVGALNSISNDLRSISLSVNTLLNEIEGRALVSHADSDGSNGVGTATKYGHVKIASSLASVDDKTGVALGVDIGTNLQNQINGKAATSHTSDTGENGVASTQTYGHVKLTNDYLEETEDDGVAASQIALCSLYRNVGSVLINMETELAGKAAKNHANSDRSIIGGGTSDMYGHVKLTDSYTSNAGSASSGVAASSQALYNAYTALSNGIGGASVIDVDTCDIAIINNIIRALNKYIDYGTYDHTRNMIGEISNCVLCGILINIYSSTYGNNILLPILNRSGKSITKKTSGYVDGYICGLCRHTEAVSNYIGYVDGYYYYIGMSDAVYVIR